MVYPALQDTLSCYFYLGKEAVEGTVDFAGRLKADNGVDYIQAVREDVARFLRAAGKQVEDRFHKELLYCFARQPERCESGLWGLPRRWWSLPTWHPTVVRSASDISRASRYWSSCSQLSRRPRNRRRCLIREAAALVVWDGEGDDIPALGLDLGDQLLRRGVAKGDLVADHA